MRVIPVLDVMGGQVVRGAGGRRDQYRPLVTPLCPGSDPLAVARAFRQHFGLTLCYLADLDAIAGAPPDEGLYRRLREDGFALWVDAGVRAVDDVRRLAAAGIEGVVAGLETLASPEELAACVREVPERLIFSLDLQGGRSLAAPPVWGDDAFAIADVAVGCGVWRLIVLDLADVGSGQGPGQLPLCARLRAVHPNVELIAGGGVRGREDLRRLRESGVDAALVASALHDGRLRRADLPQARHS